MRRTSSAIPLETSASCSAADRSSALAGASTQVRYRSATRTWPSGAAFSCARRSAGSAPARDELVEAAHGDHRGGRRRPVRLDLQVVVAHDERAARELERAKRLHVLQAVVPPGRHLEHRLARRPRAGNSFREEAVQRLGDIDQGRDAPLALGPVGHVGQRPQLAGHPGERGGAGGLGLRPVEPAERHAAGDVGGQRRARLQDAHQPVDERARLRRRGRARRSTPSAARAPPARRRRTARGRGRSGTPPAQARDQGQAR